MKIPVALHAPCHPHVINIAPASADKKMARINRAMQDSA
jgi:hypothetical protein